SPVVKKICKVLKMALGCDQKNASTKPAEAPISHSATMPTRMPSCTPRMIQDGQSFCTGSLRAGFARAEGVAGGSAGTARLQGSLTGEVCSIVMAPSRPSSRVFEGGRLAVQQVEA